MGRASDPRFSTTAGCGRAMKPARWRVQGSSRAGMDPARLLAARSEVRADDDLIVMSAPRRGQQWRRRMIRQGPKLKAANRRNVRKTATRDVDLVETVTTQHHTPGEARRPAPFPSLRRTASTKHFTL